MIGKAIKTILTGTASVAPGMLPQNASLPFVVYNITTTTPEYSKDGARVIELYRVQVDVLADTYPAMETLAASVKTALDGYRGTTGGVTIEHIRCEKDSDAYDFDPDRFRRIQEYKIRVQI